MKAILFPLSDIPIEICQHRHGAVLSWSENTDTLELTSRYAVEYYAHKYNMRIGAFINPYSQNQPLDDLIEAVRYGSMNFDIYFPTDLWFNPSTNIVEIIPDYYETVWTNLGVTAFGATLGSAKSTRTPNIGTEMYAISSGTYGWNSSGLFGTSDAVEITALIRLLNLWYKNIFETLPVSLSYRNGQDGGKFIEALNTLQSRNSSYGMYNDIPNVPTWYGQNFAGDYAGNPETIVTRNLMASRSSSFRFWDWISGLGASKAVALSALDSIITNTLANNGWVSNFIHWHNAKASVDPDLSMNMFDYYFDAIKTSLAGAEARFCSYGEASQYLANKSIVDNIAAYEDGGKIKIAVCIIDKFKNEILNEVGKYASINRQIITEPLSVVIDLTGTVLDGKFIKSSYGKVIYKGLKILVVDIPMLLNADGIIEVELFETLEDEFIKTGIPIIDNIVITGNIATFTTDIPCYSMVFEQVNSNIINKYGSRNILNYKTVHNVEFGAELATYSVGVITEHGITAAADLITIS